MGCGSIETGSKADAISKSSVLRLLRPAGFSTLLFDRDVFGTRLRRSEAADSCLTRLAAAAFELGYLFRLRGLPSSSVSSIIEACRSSNFFLFFSRMFQRYMHCWSVRFTISCEIFFHWRAPPILLIRTVNCSSS